MAAAAKRMTDQQESSTDIDMESDKDAMDQNNEREESKGDDSEIYENQDENVATGKTRRSTRLTSKNVIGIGKLSSLIFWALLQFYIFIYCYFLSPANTFSPIWPVYIGFSVHGRCRPCRRPFQGLA